MTIITRMAAWCQDLGMAFVSQLISAFRRKINHFRIHKKCYLPVKFLVKVDFHRVEFCAIAESNGLMNVRLRNTKKT